MTKGPRHKLKLAAASVVGLYFAAITTRYDQICTSSGDFDEGVCAFPDVTDDPVGVFADPSNVVEFILKASIVTFLMFGLLYGASRAYGKLRRLLSAQRGQAQDLG